MRNAFYISCLLVIIASNQAFSQWSSSCYIPVEYDNSPLFWEDPNGNIFLDKEVTYLITPGTWTCFKLPSDNVRVDLFTRDIYCSDGLAPRESLPNRAIIFPSPTDGILNINLTSGQINAHILSMDGQLVKEIYSHYHQGMFDISHLPTGMYLLKIAQGINEESHLIIKHN